MGLKATGEKFYTHEMPRSSAAIICSMPVIQERTAGRKSRGTSRTVDTRYDR